MAEAMGEDIGGLSDEQAAQVCLSAIRQLSADIGIPQSLAELGVKTEDIPTLAANAMKDACGFTNPRVATQAEIEQIFAGAM